MNSLQKRSNGTTFSLPCNPESTKITYRAGTPQGDKLIAAEADILRIKALLAKGRAATSSSGQYDVPADGKFYLSKYCEAEKLSKLEYKHLGRRLRGERKQPHALSTNPSAVKQRRYGNNKNAGKNAAKKVVRKTGF